MIAPRYDAQDRIAPQHAEDVRKDRRVRIGLDRTGHKGQADKEAAADTVFLLHRNAPPFVAVGPLWIK